MIELYYFLLQQNRNIVLLHQQSCRPSQQSSCRVAYGPSITFWLDYLYSTIKMHEALLAGVTVTIEPGGTLGNLRTGAWAAQPPPPPPTSPNGFHGWQSQKWLPWSSDCNPSSPSYSKWVLFTSIKVKHSGFFWCNFGRWKLQLALYLLPTPICFFKNHPFHKAKF